MATVTNTYARAFADVVFADRLDPAKILAEAESLAALVAGSRDLREVWHTPSIPAEQKTEGKDRADEAEKAAEFNEKLIASGKRLAEEDLREFEARKRLEREAEQALNRADDSDQDIRDMRLRDEADEAADEQQPSEENRRRQ